jgi:hypothetical protein
MLPLRDIQMQKSHGVVAWMKNRESVADITQNGACSPNQIPASAVMTTPVIGNPWFRAESSP